jgi:tetratricopeptide (TPR) repeat protein
MEAVTDRNPDDWLAYQYLGWMLLAAREYDAADASLRRAIELETAVPLTHRLIAYLEIARGNEDEALRAIDLSERLLGSDRSRVTLPEMAYVYARLGRADDAQRLFDEIDAMSATTEIGAGTWATAYLAIGDEVRALEWLEVAAEKAGNHEIDQGFYNLMHLKENLTADPVLEQPEFVDVLNRIHGD